MRTPAVLMLAVVGMVILSVRGGDKYFAESRFAFDFATRISRSDFNEPYITQLFKDFVQSKRKQYAISRLTLGVQDSDLNPALPVFALPGYVNAGPLCNGSWNEHNFVAQVVCLRGVASGTIKLGPVVKGVQIFGDHDPRELVVGKRLVRMHSFRVETKNVFFDRPFYSSEDDGITIYVVANPLLGIEQGEQLLRMMQEAIGIEAVSVVIRSDALFAPNGGPPFDVFHPPFPDVPASEYATRPLMECTPPSVAPRDRREGGTCVVRRPADEPGRKIFGMQVLHDPLAASARIRKPHPILSPP